MSNEALRKSWRREFAQHLIRSLNESGSDNYYLYIGKVDAWSDESVPETAVDSDYYASDTWRNAIALKRLDNRNIMLIVPRYNWTAGTVYKQYNPKSDLHQSGNLSKFYVLTSANRVYKCISNNKGGVSSSEPSHTTHHIVKTSDSYKWKYMYTLTEAMQEFLTEEYMPVTYITTKLVDETINQLNNQENAVHGEIPHAEIESTGNKLFTSADTQSKYLSREHQTGDTSIQLNQDASNVTGQYVGYSLYLDDGRGSEIGFLSKITSYDGVTKIAIIEDGLPHKTYLPGTQGLKGTSYKILPSLKVHGDGRECVLIPQLDEVKKIAGVEVLRRGKNYSDATVEIETTAASGTTDSRFTLFFSPAGGHGSDAPRELQATRAMIFMRANQGDLTSTWPASNDFRQFGIVKNPVLNQAGFTADTTVAGNEYTRLTELKIIKPYGISAAYNYDSVDGTYKVGNYIIGKDTKSTAKVLAFKDEPETDYSILDVQDKQGTFKVADPIKEEFRYVFGSVVGNYQVGETVTQYVSLTGGNPGATAQGFVQEWNTTPYKELVIVGVTGSFSGTTGAIVGLTSGASASDIRSFQVGGGELIKQFRTDSTGDFYFVSVDSGDKQDYGRVVQQKSTKINLTSPPSYRLTHKLSITGSGFSDTYFNEDSGVTQENSTSNSKTSSRVFAFKAYSGTTGDLFLTDVLGGFTTGSTLDTHASTNITVNKIHEPEVVLGSGELLYIQNIRPVERIREQEEEFRIILGF